jgi:hypothetical protein
MSYSHDERARETTYINLEWTFFRLFALTESIDAGILIWIVDGDVGGVLDDILMKKLR